MGKKRMACLHDVFRTVSPALSPSPAAVYPPKPLELSGRKEGVKKVGAFRGVVGSRSTRFEANAISTVPSTHKKTRIVHAKQNRAWYLPLPVNVAQASERPKVRGAKPHHPI